MIGAVGLGGFAGWLSRSGGHVSAPSRVRYVTPSARGASQTRGLTSERATAGILQVTSTARPRPTQEVNGQIELDSKRHLAMLFWEPPEDLSIIHELVLSWSPSRSQVFTLILTLISTENRRGGEMWPRPQSSSSAHPKLLTFIPPCSIPSPFGEPGSHSLRPLPVPGFSAFYFRLEDSSGSLQIGRASCRERV